MPPESSITDQFGVPFSREYIRSLRTETAPVGAQHARPAFTGHLAFGMDPARLAAIVRAADQGNSLDFMVLAEEIEEHFTHYSSSLSKRRRQVAQLPVTVEAAPGEAPAETGAFEAHAEFVRAWLKTQVLQGALFDILDGIGKGYSVHEIIWDQRPGRVWPAQLIYRPQRFFEFSWEDQKTLWLRGETGFADLSPHKFLVHLHPAKSGNTIRSGITRMVAFLWCYATYTQRDWALFAQAYGLPIRVGKYGQAASDEDKRTLYRAVASIAGDVAAIIPESMQIEFIEASDRAAGASIYEKRLDWFNREVSKLLLGGTAGTEALHGGHAVGQEHRAAEQDVERFDAFLLNTTINSQLLPAMVAFTFGPQRAYPTINIGRPDEVPLNDFVGALEKLVPLGLRVRTEEIYSRLGLQPPEESDDVLGLTAKPEPPEPKKPTTNQEPVPGDSATGLTAGFLDRFVRLTADMPEEDMNALSARLADDMAGALGGLTAQIQAEFGKATDMHDLGRRLHKLKLNETAFAEAMARGMALANLVGQASLIEETRTRSKRQSKRRR